MFTGIVEEVGCLLAVEPVDGAVRLRIEGRTVVQDLRHGDSVAVDGVCLTASAVGDGCFTADVMPETLRRSTLGEATAGRRVNLERALTPASRLGGHIVQGHVDGVGRIVSRAPGPRWDEVVVELPSELTLYVAEKGSITVDGVSLTVAAVDDDTFTVGLIPTTLAETTLGDRAVGATVNVEVDVLAKYVERLTTLRP